MNELQIRIKRLRKVMLILVILDFSGYFLTEYQAVFAGLLFGMAFGYLNIGFMARRVNQVAQEALLYEEGKNFRMPSSKPFFSFGIGSNCYSGCIFTGNRNQCDCTDYRIDDTCRCHNHRCFIVSNQLIMSRKRGDCSGTWGSIW